MNATNINTEVTPEKFNICLTRHGKEIDFDFPPATDDLITRFAYIVPKDDRCEAGVINSEDELFTLLQPVMGTNRVRGGALGYKTKKQTIIALHDTAILGYQRQTIVDSMLNIEIGDMWEIYLDTRVFPQSDEPEWCNIMSDIIIREQDSELAEDIKNRLLDQAK